MTQVTNRYAEGQIEVLNVTSLLDPQHVLVQLSVKCSHIINLIHPAKEAIQEHSAKLGFQKEHFIDGLADNLAQKDIELQGLFMNSESTDRRIKGLIVSGAEHPKLRIEHSSANRDHEFFEKASTVHAALWATIRCNELDSEDIPQLALLGEPLESCEAILYKKVSANLVPLHGVLRPWPTRVASLLLVCLDDILQQTNPVCKR
mmetsp:Transcript_9517/g.18241  ORF Transcript_9517/g.18241 Transcript_9517/m.18241 type:complete len:204 (-) Transcript_9517:109-720(-)